MGAAARRIAGCCAGIAYAVGPRKILGRLSPPLHCVQAGLRPSLAPTCLGIAVVVCIVDLNDSELLFSVLLCFESGGRAALSGR